MDFPVIQRAELMPHIKEKKNCMDCCNPETVDIRKERQSRAVWMKQLQLEMANAWADNREVKDEKKLFKRLDLVSNELLKQARIDEK